MNFATRHENGGFLFVLSTRGNALYFRYMRKEQVISGAEAIRRMRLISRMKDETFTLIHFTCNLKTGKGGELRKVEHCRLRAALPEKVTKVDPDHYLTYVISDIDEPRMCWKKLIRFVAFPPRYDLFKVDWFID